MPNLDSLPFYRIMQGNPDYAFERGINEMIVDGWVPVGSPFMNQAYICQVMMRLDNEAIQKTIEEMAKV